MLKVQTPFHCAKLYPKTLSEHFPQQKVPIFPSIFVLYNTYTMNAMHGYLINDENCRAHFCLYCLKYTTVSLNLRMKIQFINYVKVQSIIQ